MLLPSVAMLKDARKKEADPEAKRLLGKITESSRTTQLSECLECE